MATDTQKYNLDEIRQVRKALETRITDFVLEIELPNEPLVKARTMEALLNTRCALRKTNLQEKYMLTHNERTEDANYRTE